MGPQDQNQPAVPMGQPDPAQTPVEPVIPPAPAMPGTGTEETPGGQPGGIV